MTTKQNTTGHDDTTRRAAIAIVRDGLANPSEAARLAGVSRQVVYYWLTQAGVRNHDRTRAAWLAKQWARLHR